MHKSYNLYVMEVSTMFDLKKVSRPVDERAHICLPCYFTCPPVGLCAPIYIPLPFPPDPRN